MEKVPLNKNYIVRKLNCNKTKILHHIRLRKNEPNTVLQDSRPEGNLQQDDETVIPRDDLYVISWETNFGEFHNSNEEVTIPTLLDAEDNFNSLEDDASPNFGEFHNSNEEVTIPTLLVAEDKFNSLEDDASQAKFSPTWTLSPPGHMKIKTLNRPETSA